MYKEYHAIKNLMNWLNLFVIHIIIKHINTNRFIILEASRFTKVNILKFKKVKQIQCHQTRIEDKLLPGLFKSKCYVSQKQSSFSFIVVLGFFHTV